MSDDPIWQDLGLEEVGEEEDSAPRSIPRWLGDKAVRDGIIAMLEVDRCEEEYERLRLERCAIQEWTSAEWEAITTAWHGSGT